MNKRSVGNIQKLEEGKYRLRLSAKFDDFGKRIQLSKVVYCETDIKAEKMLMEFYKEKEKLSENRGSSAPQTLEELYNEWLKNHVAINLTERTAAFYKSYWKLYVQDKSKIKLAIIKPTHIYQIIGGIEGDRTKNGVFKMLKSLLNKGVQWGYLTDNPCNRVETPKYKAEEKQTLLESDIENIITIIPKESTKYQAIFYFAALCGLRRQEIVGLQWTDIDFDGDSFQISRAATEVKGKGTIIKETKTSKSRRKLHLPDTLKIILQELQKEQSEHALKVGERWNDESWIFTRWDGKIMSIDTPTIWWNKFIKSNNLSVANFHTLRHTAASFMIKNNVPISTVSSILGHANITTTLNTYTHVIEDTKKEAINIMENVFSKK